METDHLHPSQISYEAGHKAGKADSNREDVDAMGERAHERMVIEAAKKFEDNDAYIDGYWTAYCGD